MTTRAAAFCRVSTDHQEASNQIPAVEQLAAHRGYELTQTFTVSDSAFKDGESYQAAMARMLDAAHRGEFSVLVVWSADRLTRKGIEDLLKIIRKLRESGVTLVSVTEPWLSGNDATTELLVAIAAWVAHQESARRSERIKAGLDRRRAAGLPVGRQAGSKDLRPRKRSSYFAVWEARRAAAA